MKKAQIYIILVLLLGIISFSYVRVLWSSMFKGCDLALLLVGERNVLSMLSNIDYETFNLVNFTNVSWNNVVINLSQLANWTYRYKIPIILKEEGGKLHVNEVIAVNITFPQATDNCSIEIYCEGERTNYYIANWTDLGTQINSTILFNFSLEPNSIKHCSLYFQRWSRRGCKSRTILVANATNVTVKVLHYVELKIILMDVKFEEKSCEALHQFIYPLVVK